MSPKSKSVSSQFNPLEQQMELSDLLERFRYCEATDPRDKIYAILGMASDIDLGDINIDYMLPVQQLYQNVDRFLITKHKNLDILGAFKQQKSPFQSLLPSWVPDWSFSTIHVDEQSFSRKLVNRDSKGSVSKAYFASGNTAVSANCISDMESLVLKVLFSMPLTISLHQL